jgi:hypothetical protein
MADQKTSSKPVPKQSSAQPTKGKRETVEVRATRML